MSIQIVGADYSMNSPACVKFLVDDALEIVEISYIGFSSVKKTVALDPNHILHYKDFSNQFEKIYWFRDQCIDFIKPTPQDYCAIEDYAFCGVGKVFNIAETTGAFKNAVYNSGASLRAYPPTSIKKFSTGLGNADKTKMSVAFNATEYAKLFGRLLEGNPREDLVDAFFVAQMLLSELKVRKGLLNLSDLSKKQSECFTQTSKSNPETILNRVFIQKPLDT